MVLLSFKMPMDHRSGLESCWSSVLLASAEHSLALLATGLDSVGQADEEWGHVGGIYDDWSENWTIVPRKMSMLDGTARLRTRQRLTTVVESRRGSARHRKRSRRNLSPWTLRRYWRTILVKC